MAKRREGRRESLADEEGLEAEVAFEAEEEVAFEAGSGGGEVMEVGGESLSYLEGWLFSFFGGGGNVFFPEKRWNERKFLIFPFLFLQEAIYIIGFLMFRYPTFHS